MAEALRAMFVLYAAIGLLVWVLYSRLPRSRVVKKEDAVAIGPSRAIVARLAGLFAVDAFAGGLVIDALLALWLFERFGISLTAAGALLSGPDS